MTKSTPTSSPRSGARLDFDRISAAALSVLPAILNRLGVPWRRAGAEIDMIATHRGDRTFGSFRINTRTGRWADFATNDRGGDAVSLVAHLRGCGQAIAATDLARLLNLETENVC